MNINPPCKRKVDKYFLCANNFSMKSRNGFFAIIICLAMVCRTAMAGNCSDEKYRENNPIECQFFIDGATSFFGAAGLVGGALALVGISASSGGDGGTSAPVQPTLTVPAYVGNDISAAELAGVMQNASYVRNMDQYNNIRLAWSLARGYTGRGTTIAVLDAGADTWHGKTVASFASGAIAPDANVVQYKIVDENMKFLSYREIGNAIASATDANVYNASWAVSMSATSLTSRAQLERVTDKHFVDEISAAARTRDAIFVWAAGNDGMAQSGTLSAMPRVIPELNGHFVNVVAFDDATGALADYSNACGITRDWCITAPGSLHTDYTTAYGTSFAAPVVSAAIAVLRQAFPYLTAPQITSLLFETARDLGAPGVDDVYGHGMLDLERATRPVGTALVPIGGTMQPLAAARVSGQIAHNIKSANPQFAFFDEYGRAFSADISENITIQNQSQAWRHLHGNDDIVATAAGNFEFGFRDMDFLPADGLFGIGDKSFISFASTTRQWELDKITLFQTASIGMGRPHTNDNSMITDISGITTASAAIGARVRDWQFAMRIPDTIISGNMTMHTPVGRMADGTIVYNDYTIDLSATRPSVEFTAKYKFLTAGFVDNPYGTDELFVVGRWNIRF